MKYYWPFSTIQRIIKDAIENALEHYLSKILDARMALMDERVKLLQHAERTAKAARMATALDKIYNMTEDFRKESADVNR